jgi:hypothetical protein
VEDFVASSVEPSVHSSWFVNLESLRVKKAAVII